jgi:hypothetical protein
MFGPVLEQLQKCLALYWSSYKNVWPCIGAVTQMSGPVLKQLQKCLALYWSNYKNVWPCTGAVTKMWRFFLSPVNGIPTLS